MTATVVIENEQPSSAEAPAVVAEVVETSTDAAIQIAEIEANKEITIAAIQAETDQLRSDNNVKETEQWQENRLSQLEANLSSLREELPELITSSVQAAIASALLTPPVQPPLSESETPSITTTQTEVLSETVTEAPASAEPSEEVVLVAEAPPKRPPVNFL